MDSQTRTYIDEFSNSNTLFLTSRNPDKITLVVPDSPCKLQSVTAKSIVDIAAKTFGWDVQVRPVKFSEVIEGKFDECCAAGTAAAITPVGSISYTDPQGKRQTAQIGPEPKTAGPYFVKLLQELTGLQAGDREDTFGWGWPAEGIKPE